MPDIEAIEVLTQAKERIMEHGWGRGSSNTRDDFGDTESYCLEDALCRERGMFVTQRTPWEPALARAADYVRQAIGWSNRPGVDLYQWNDGIAESANAVFTALDDAILIAKESGV